MNIESLLSVIFNIHFIFDVLSYLSAFILSYYILKINPSKTVITNLSFNDNNKYPYYSILLLGMAIGAFGIGTLNVYYSTEQLWIGKSVLGGIFGAVVFAEIYKYFNKIKTSTGAYFVPSLAIGIAIGRIGCYLSGMEDYTYGIETSSFIGHDFGDGKQRLPVQLFESGLMFIFFLYSLIILKYKKIYFEKVIFYQFIFFYAFQRFILEFLKPYKDLYMGLNIFQFVCILLMIYAITFFYNSFRKTENKMTNV